MRTADEIALVYTLYGASLSARAAGYTFLVIYRSEIVNYVNSIGRTRLFALSARDASVFTVHSDRRALIVVVPEMDGHGLVEPSDMHMDHPSSRLKMTLDLRGIPYNIPNHKEM